MNEVLQQDARTGTPEAMGPPSYKALSVEHAPWSHTQRHPGSPAAPHAPTHIAARSMPTKRGKPAARLHNAHTRPVLARPPLLDAGHARTPLTTPLPRAITGFDPLYRPSGRRSALGRSAQWHSLAISQPSHAGARRPPHSTNPTARIPRTQRDTPATHTSPMHEHPAHASDACTTASRDGCLPLLTSH